jgi:MFS family permease
MRSFLINRDFARLWYGQSVSTVGDYVFDTTLVLWVATVLSRGQRWAPVAVSGIMLCVGAAVLLVGPLAGVFVDRLNRKAVMLHSEIVRAAVAATLAFLASLPTHVIPVWAWLTLIYLIVFVLNAAGQFFSPARFAVLGNVVSGDGDRARAAGIGQATIAAAAIIGPPIAAPLLFTIGVQWALAINAASYVFSYFAIRGVRVADPAEPAGGVSEAAVARGLRAEFTGGLRFFARTRFLVILLSIAVIAQVGTGALNTLDVFFVTQNLHAPARLYGILSTAFGAGAIAGALCAGRVVRRLGARNTTWLGLLASGALVFCYARQAEFVPGLIVIGAIAIPVSMLNTAMAPLLLKATPPEYLGRMAAVFNPVNQLASMLSALVAGWLASSALHNFRATVLGVHIGPVDTIFAAAGIAIFAAGGYALVRLPREEALAGMPATGVPAETATETPGAEAGSLAVGSE